MQIYDFSKMYGDSLSLDIYSEQDLQMEECIWEFWKELSEKLQIVEPEAVQKQDSIRQFLAMKDTTQMPEEKQIRYMSIDAKEYQNREHALGTVENVLAGEPGAAIKKEDKGRKNNHQKAKGNDYKKRQDGTIEYPQSKPASKDKEVEGEIIRYDARKQQLLVRLEQGKEIGIGMNPFQGAVYNGQEKKKVMLLKNGNDYSVKK